jgi:molybdopterin synthase catalytic subunit
MKIQVRYFAVFRERLGREEELLELPGDAATVADALALLGRRHPPIAALAGRFRVAVNQEMVGGSAALAEGDELALIPPVAGGTGAPRRAVVLPTALSLDRVLAAVRHPGAGGVVTFTGAVRAESQGRQVVRLEYEAYREMAESVFARLCDSIEAEHPGVRLALEHRVGALEVGDVAVVIAASAPHRAAAFAACRALIDRLKEEAPIWKKEIGPDGEEWVGLGP